jgi:hypothetical protein
MKTFEAMPASAERFLLGEGPIWDAARGRLLWIDIDDGAVLIGRVDGDRVLVEDRLDFAGPERDLLVITTGTAFPQGET